MGSSCSILNDTQHDVWITNREDWEILLAVIRGLVTLCEIGASVLAPLQNVASVLEMSDVALAKRLSINQSEAGKMKCAIKEFQGKAELIKPGEKYTWSGTLSLTMRIFVMNDKLQCDDKSCLTGPTAGSERVYTISEHFKKLDIYK
ncbi:Hypothetical predicted protein [Paramuricea clavata]|uniref:Uncharacterized protein n=2 Tax=Paramuricea clavata TaxID=317549 RepID=A0A7D9JBZ8_PARCT|nr:Hypothetical predicted protein [Paramuricea clavata]